MLKGHIGKIAEVICQHTKEHKIIPLRVRFENEDKMIETYNILSFKDMNKYGSDGLPLSNHVWEYICKLDAGNGRIGYISLRYFAHEGYWAVENTNI